MVFFLAEIKIFRFWPKTMDYNKAFLPIVTIVTIRRFYRNRGDFLRSFYSTVEGAMKLKFAPFCSSWDALSYGILFGRNQNFQILAENHGL